MARWFWFLLVQLGLSGASGQALRFQQLTTDDGLSDNAITCFFEDRAGYIWIGTEGGLDRFDGQTVIPVAAIREPISAVLEDRDGVLWVATRGFGLHKLAGDRSRVEPFTQDPEAARPIDSDQITSLFDLDDSTLLIGARERPFLFLDKRTLRISYWTDSTSLSPSAASATDGGMRGWCHGFTPLGKNMLWINMLNSHESLVVDLSSGAIVQRVSHERPGNETIVVATELDGQVYASGWQQGIDRLTYETGIGWTPIDPLPLDDEGVALATWGAHHLVCGTRSKGLRIMDTRTGKITAVRHNRSDPTELPSNRIHCLLAAKNGTLWVGTSNGVAYHAPGVWTMEEHALHTEAEDPEMIFHRLIPEGDGSLRAFTSIGFRILHADGVVEQVPVRLGALEMQPTFLYADGHGVTLLGTEHGLLRWDPEAERFTEPLSLHAQGGPPFSPGNMFQVRSLISDSLNAASVVHVAALGYHSMMVDPGSGRILGYSVPTAALRHTQFSLVHDMVKDRKARFWHATAGGLYFWDPSMPLLAGPKANSGNGTHGIVVEGVDVRQLILAADTLWALLHEGAILRIVGDRTLRIAPPDHLARRMFGFAQDGNGRFWITTTEGLLRYDPLRNDWLAVPVNEGVRYRKLTKAITAQPGGEMAFCAANKIFTFDPNVFDALPEPPAVRLTMASAGGAPVAITEGQITLPFSAPLIDVAVSALAQGLPGSLTFLVRLEGVEEEWREISSGEVVRYVGVPVGRHRLLAKSRDVYGRDGVVRTLVTVDVRAPFWLTWWFYALVAAVVSAGVYAWSRYRLAQALKLHAVRDRIASDLHDEVGSSLSSITIGSQLAQQLGTQENEQVKQLLARIGETSSASLRSISDIVWAIDPKNDEGEALVKRMRRIASELLESKGVEVSFSVSGGVEELSLPMNARKEIVLIFKEAVHNVSKHSGAANVHWTLHRRGGSLSMGMKDDGKGFDPALHPDGHGLGSMKRRAVALGTVLVLQSAPGAGTHVGMEVDLTRIRD